MSLPREPGYTAKVEALLSAWRRRVRRVEERSPRPHRHAENAVT